MLSLLNLAMSVVRPPKTRMLSSWRTQECPVSLLAASLPARTATASQLARLAASILCTEDTNLPPVVEPPRV